jgi:drug/metabolite transporter (DMT)-like permease
MTAVFALLLLGEKLSAGGIAGAVIIVICIAAGAIIREEPGV